jgi:hypothetical protein
MNEQPKPWAHPNRKHQSWARAWARNNTPYPHLFEAMTESQFEALYGVMRVWFSPFPWGE